MRNPTGTLLGLAALGIAAVRADAAVERYKDEALYLSRLAELGYASLREDFEGPDWDGIRNTISKPSTTPSISRNTP